MGKDYILVIDEGTTGTRAILFDKKFQIAEQSYEEFCQHTPAENMVEHDAEEIYDLNIQESRYTMHLYGRIHEWEKCVRILKRHHFLKRF